MSNAVDVFEKWFQDLSDDDKDAVILHVHKKKRVKLAKSGFQAVNVPMPTVCPTCGK